MNRLITFLMLFITCCVQQSIFAQESTSKQEEQMPESYKEWEKENSRKEAVEDTKYGDLWNKTLLLLIFVLLILFAGTWYLKKFGPIKGSDKGGQGMRIQLLERRVISPKAVVYLLSIDGHKIALSETSTGIQLLGSLGHEPKP